MLFSKLAVFALPVLGAFASPIQKRDAVSDVKAIVSTLESSVESAVTSLTNNATALVASEVETLLGDILAAVNTASSAVKSVSKRDIVEVDGELVARDVSDEVTAVGQTLASVIQDVVKAIENIESDLSSLPVIGSLIGEISSGLNVLLLGGELVLGGLISVVTGLLGGVLDTLSSLGLGSILSALGL